LLGIGVIFAFHRGQHPGSTAGVGIELWQPARPASTPRARAVAGGGEQPGGKWTVDLEMLLDHALLDYPITAQQSLKIPSKGASLRLNQPVDAYLGDLLVCACVDFPVLPRGYVSS
jgi:hypothetical protein